MRVSTDLDRDGYSDLVTVSAKYGVIRVQYGGGFLAAQSDTQDISLPQAAGRLVAFDYDGDGYTDLIADSGPSYAGMLNIIHNRHSRQYELSARYAAPQNVALADLNSDGLLDFIETETGGLTI